MTGATMFSGIQAPETALPWVDWKWCAEIERTPCAIIKRHHPQLPNLGDVNAEDFSERARAFGSIDLLIAGAPCQDFSVAGQRAGMAGARGNLSLRFVELVGDLRPVWLLFENVPGLLSSTSHEAPDQSPPPDDLQPGQQWSVEDDYEADEGSDFGYFLAALLELGYSLSYASLDAQYFGVAQRRERLFVVGHLGGLGRSESASADVGTVEDAGTVRDVARFPSLPTAVLFDRESLSWNPAPCREEGQGSADFTVDGFTPSGYGQYRDGAGTLRKNGGDVGGGGQRSSSQPSPCASTGGMRIDAESETFVVGALSADTHPGSYSGQDAYNCKLLASPLGAQAGRNQIEQSYVPCAVQEDNQNGVVLSDTAGGLRSNAPGTQPTGTLAMVRMGVRRLTPREAERLQGFPDDFTATSASGKEIVDGPRYAALGNSMAVPVVSWVGERIRAVIERRS